MKKAFTLLSLFVLFILSGWPSGNAEENKIEKYKLNYQYKDIVSINFDIVTGAGRPQKADDTYLRNNFSYSTEFISNIIYIVHYINSFGLVDDEKYTISSDGSYASVSLKTTNGLVNKINFVDGERLLVNNKQYAVDKNEYRRFINFIYALKTEKIIIDDEIQFEPSDWAQKEVSKAVNLGLVPELNQINYTGKISRLEVCQLIENFLSKKDITCNEHMNPFIDIDDKSVVALYNLGIICGKTKSQFNPYDHITREEFAKMLSRTYHMFTDSTALRNSTVLYTDQEKISDWALNSVNEVSTLKLFIGNDNSEFQPQKNITKEEVIITLIRLYNIIDNK